MASNSVNFTPENTPFTINADILDTPVLVCDSDFKIIYKNRASCCLEIKRLGSYITHYISSNDKNLLQQNNFSNTPCICLYLNLKDNKNQNFCAYVCNHTQTNGNTLWIIPRMPSVYFKYLSHINDFQSKLLSFMPSVARCIVANKSSNQWQTQHDLAKIISQKCLLTAINYLSSFTPSNTIAFEYMVSILRRFIFEHFTPLGYNVNVISIQTYHLFLVENSSVFLCLYLNLLITLLECSKLPHANINVKLENDMVVIETSVNLEFVPDCQNDLDWLAFIYKNHSFNFTVCCKLCEILGFKVNIFPYSDGIYNCKISLKSRILLPGMLRSPSNDDFDVMYNKFIYFLKDI